MGLNIASSMSTAVKSLRANGIECRGIVRYSHHYTSDETLEKLPGWVSRRHPLQWTRAHLSQYSRALSAIAWADVLHWYFGVTLLRERIDLQWAKMLGKPGVVEFLGSDIRIAEIENQDNPYFARYAPEDYRKGLSHEHSCQVQEAFSGMGCLVQASLLPSVRRDLFRNISVVHQRIPLSDFAPQFPLSTNKKPVVVHAPSNRGIKGTDFVLAAVDALRGQNFEFRLVHNESHEEAVSRIAEADIFVDQLLIGDHGFASIEAMALGKPVVCYIKPSVQSQLPADCPIVNANPDTIRDVLAELISNADQRAELGRRSRLYVEKYHDPPRIAEELEAIYRQAQRN